MPPGLAWIAGVPCPNHGLRQFDIIPGILAGATNFNQYGIYSVLRLPMYKTYPEHMAHRAAVIAEFNGCQCLNARPAYGCQFSTTPRSLLLNRYRLYYRLFHDL